MNEPLPIPVYPYPMSEAHSQSLRAAKGAMNVSYLIKPVPAVPGGPGRVLAFGAIPDFACECVLVAADKTEDAAHVQAALEFYMSAREGDRGLITHEMWLSAVMGMDVKFLYEMRVDEFADPRDLDPAHADFVRARHEGKRGPYFA